jgi:uncharacterized paraquat-inducible protein A
MEIEVGLERSGGPYNDFKRCPNCKWGYFVNALVRGGKIQCPRCGEIREREAK